MDFINFYNYNIDGWKTLVTEKGNWRCNWSFEKHIERSEWNIRKIVYLQGLARTDGLAKIRLDKLGNPAS